MLWNNEHKLSVSHCPQRWWPWGAVASTLCFATVDYLYLGDFWDLEVTGSGSLMSVFHTRSSSLQARGRRKPQEAKTSAQRYFVTVGSRRLASSQRSGLYVFVPSCFPGAPSETGKCSSILGTYWGYHQGGQGVGGTCRVTLSGPPSPGPWRLPRGLW